MYLRFDASSIDTDRIDASRTSRFFRYRYSHRGYPSKYAIRSGRSTSSGRSSASLFPSIRSGPSGTTRTIHDGVPGCSGLCVSTTRVRPSRHAPASSGSGRSSRTRPVVFSMSRTTPRGA